jgi:hypothetical protein
VQDDVAIGAVVVVTVGGPVGGNPVEFDGAVEGKTIEIEDSILEIRAVAGRGPAGIEDADGAPVGGLERGAGFRAPQLRQQTLGEYRVFAKAACRGPSAGREGHGVGFFGWTR